MAYLCRILSIFLSLCLASFSSALSNLGDRSRQTRAICIVPSSCATLLCAHLAVQRQRQGLGPQPSGINYGYKEVSNEKSGLLPALPTTDHRQRLTHAALRTTSYIRKVHRASCASFDHPNIASLLALTISLLRGESANIYSVHTTILPTTVNTASLRSFLHMVGRVTTLDSLFVVTAAAAVQRTIAGITTAREEKHHGDEPQGKPDCRKVESHPEGISNLDAVPEGGCEIVVHLVDCKSAEIGSNNTRLQEAISRFCS